MAPGHPDRPWARSPPRWLGGRAGSAVRPLHRVRVVAEDIEATDLSRRIGLRRGSIEVTALAASFDGMLDRLEAAEQTQRHLIEEASHELRVPLSVLMTNADVLLDHPAPTMEIYRQGLERSRAAADRLTRAIDELLVDARGRARTLSRRPTDLVTVVLAAGGGCPCPRRGAASSSHSRSPPAVVGRVDEPSVRRAVSNLIDNAIRHAPAESTVDVRIEGRPDWSPSSWPTTVTASRPTSRSGYSSVSGAGTRRPAVDSGCPSRARSPKPMADR